MVCGWEGGRESNEVENLRTTPEQVSGTRPIKHSKHKHTPLVLADGVVTLQHDLLSLGFRRETVAYDSTPGGSNAEYRRPGYGFAASSWAAVYVMARGGAAWSSTILTWASPVNLQRRWPPMKQNATRPMELREKNATYSNDFQNVEPREKVFDAL